MARGGVTRKTVELSTDNLDWLNEHYPKMSWTILDMLLERFRLAHEKTPSDYARIGAEELKAFLDDGGLKSAKPDPDKE